MKSLIIFLSTPGVSLVRPKSWAEESVAALGLHAVCPQRRGCLGKAAEVWRVPLQGRPPHPPPLVSGFIVQGENCLAWRVGRWGIHFGDLKPSRLRLGARFVGESWEDGPCAWHPETGVPAVGSPVSVCGCTHFHRPHWGGCGFQLVCCQLSLRTPGIIH